LTASNKTPSRKEIVRILKEREVVKKGDFLLHLGNRSQYYIDLRSLPSYPDDFDRVSTAFAELVSRTAKRIDRIVGAAHGAAPFTVAVSLKLGKPYALIRKIESENSFRDPIHGEILAGEHVVLLDDVASTGITLACMSAIVRAKKAFVEAAVVLVDRNLGAKELLRSYGVNLYSLVELSELL